MRFFTNAKARVGLATSRFKYLFIKRPDTDTANPYLNARRTWNLHVGSVVYSRFVWQMMALLGMLIGLAAVGGMTKVASMSKFVPFLYERTATKEAQALGPAMALSPTDQSIQFAELKRFIEDARLVTPDALVQRKAIDRVYSKMLSEEAAVAKLNAWFQQNPPGQRAEKIVVNTQNMTALPLSAETVQIDWQETTHDRTGVSMNEPVTWRAIVTHRYIEPTPETSLREMELNPARVFVRDFSWTQISTK